MTKIANNKSQRVAFFTSVHGLQVDILPALLRSVDRISLFILGTGLATIVGAGLTTIVGAGLGTIVGAGLGTIVGAGLGTIVGAGLGTKFRYSPITEQQNPPSSPIT
ncbi:hypothetical protein, partial [Coleofasciculus sp. G2-EDA-02]|uniref:hypothetical protein n=1 Tax=Coleofasciculus sp. G2-EDA-02 TaxID=3069529 RepID=UPI003300E95C